MGYIYSIKNKQNNHRYIGQSIQNDIEKRWKEHKKNMNTSYCPYLYAAFRKYGIENFEFRVICICFDDACDDLERFYIQKYNTLYPNGYNLDAGGRKNKEIHAETREKIRKALTGKKHSESRKQKNRESHIGYKHKDSTKKKMSLQRKGKHISQDIREKISRSQIGHSVADSTKKAVSEANSKREWTEQMRKAMSEKMQGDTSRWKSVGRFSLDNIYIDKYDSIKKASEDCNVNRNSIAKVCYGQRKTGGGYIWKFLDEERI